MLFPRVSFSCYYQVILLREEAYYSFISDVMGLHNAALHLSSCTQKRHTFFRHDFHNLAYSHPYSKPFVSGYIYETLFAPKCRKQQKYDTAPKVQKNDDDNINNMLCFYLKCLYTGGKKFTPWANNFTRRVACISGKS